MVKVYNIFTCLEFHVTLRICKSTLESETKSESESQSEDEQESPKGKRREELSDHSRDQDNEETERPAPALGGERVKGKYTLRKIQPIERYCPGI
jgi:hypothetical protein